MTYTKTFNFLLLFLLSGLLTACSSKVDFKKSSVVPAAQVEVQIDQDKNDNYEVKVKVKNLAQPESLTPSSSLYMVWVETKYGTYNIGRLNIDDKLNGSLEATTPYPPRVVKITAEDGMVTQPSKMVILTSQSTNVN